MGVRVSLSNPRAGALSDGGNERIGLANPPFSLYPETKSDRKKAWL